MRHSLLLRLLALSLAVALGAVFATAALATYGTSAQLRSALESDASLVETDSFVYQTLNEYARQHETWDGVEETVRDLAKRLGRRIALTNSRGEVVADSARLLDQGSTELPSVASATIDAISAGDARISVRAMTGGASFGDTRTVAGGGAAGTLDMFQPAFITSRYSDDEIRERVTLAKRAESCWLDKNIVARIVVSRTGELSVVAQSPSSQGLVQVPVSRPGGETLTPFGAREAVQGTAEVIRPAEDACVPKELNAPPKREVQINKREVGALKKCLTRERIEFTVAETTNGLQSVLPADPESSSQSLQFDNCASSARADALKGFVAPTALLYLGNSERFNAFAGDGLWRTLATAFGVLLLAALITVVAGRRMVRPIHALTSAARRMTAGDRSARVPAAGRDEVARMGHAFNTMAESIETAEQQRRSMVSDVAHELRTPLSNVRGYLEAAEDGVVPLDQSLVRSLLEEAGLLEHLVTDLQDLALADAGMLRLHPEETDLEDLARQVVSAHRASADAASVTLTADTEPVTASVDPARMRQVLGNLVDNALKYTPSGGDVKLSLRTEKSKVVVTLEDTGTGIGAEHLPHLFDRFYRADPSRNRSTGGSGLGLAIAKHLVEAHGGAISVTSKEGEGTTFTIRLPSSESLTLS